MKLPPFILNETSDDQAVFALSLPVTLDAFRDHFPDHPILPGVVQVDWAVQLANQHMSIAIPSARDFQIKFRQIIHPDMPITLTLQRDKAKNRLSFTYRHKDDVMSSGSIRLASLA